MNLRLVGVCLLCFLFPVVMSLVCYTCSTTISWNACATTSQTCHPAFDRCGKVYTKVGDVETFAKKCLLKKQCVKEANTTCKAATKTMECEVHCCDTDGCNDGSTFHISGILLLTCALAYLMIVTKA
ncbi:hypothetical protein ACROYT_G041669 [Oculina patagonica]